MQNLWWICFLLTSSCSLLDGGQQELVSQDQLAEQEGTAGTSQHTDRMEGAQKTSEKSSCIALPSDQDARDPAWLPDLGVVVTKFTETCSLPDGKLGIRPSSSVIAMGFPCTNGEGRIDVQGNYWVPKVVSFLLATDCPMGQPRENLENEIRTKLHLRETSSVLAINPFATQYWEIAGLEDADLGFTVDLRSPKAKQLTWRQFTEGAPIPIRLFGRENAWGGAKNLFEVDGELNRVSPYRFGLTVTGVRLLSDSDISQVKNRCLALTPQRRCASVF